MTAIKIFNEFLEYEEQKMEELSEKSAMQTTKEQDEIKENAGIQSIYLCANILSLKFEFE
jgi:hypothetical protein